MESTGKKKKSSASSSMLAPGFRFHPTDEELVRYYLRRKVCGKAFPVDAISEIDIYKAEPWDLPSMSKLKTRDLEWYFFSVLDKKYGNGARTNRATEKGYWKTTGKDRTVYYKSQIVGMKKTLVYHSGRAPKGQRSNWVMHEYRLADSELEKTGVLQDAFVLCRVFQKSGSGPKNGEQYGAPFVEEEWEYDELESDPKKEGSEEVDFGGDVYLDGHDLEQILGLDYAPNICPSPLNFQSGDGSNVGETKSVSDTQKHLVCADEGFLDNEQLDYKNLYDMPALYDMDLNLVKHEYIGESSKSGNSLDVDYLVNEPFMNPSDYLPFGDEGFIEANDLSNPVEANASDFDMLEEYLKFFDAIDDDSQCLANDTSVLLGSEENGSSKKFITPKDLNMGTEPAMLPSGRIINNSSVDAASVSNKQDSAKYQSDSKYPYVKKASQMLGDIPAPPAFAAEFPAKEAYLHYNYAQPSTSSLHVTTGMIQIHNLTHSNGTAPSSGKRENTSIILSFGFSRGYDGSVNLESRVSIHPEKTISAISRDWFYFIFLWVFILSMGFKMGMYICAK